MAMNPEVLSTEMEAKIFAKLKERLTSKLPADASDDQRAAAEENLADIAFAAGQVAEEIINHIKTLAEIQCTIPSGSFIQTVAGQAVGTPNAAPLPITGKVIG